jgi:hypothetical protein
MTSFPTTLPPARTPPSEAAPALRWGVLGTGWIAERFVGSLQRHTRQRLVAVGSRDAGRSAAFASRHGLPRAHGSYEALVADPDVDVVYVATPHPAHHPCATLALEAGKHILVEKPLALNAAQATEIARLAADRGRFCAEALWTFFLPKFDIVRQLLADGVLGEVRTVLADHGERSPPSTASSGPTWPAGPCWTSAPTRCPWPPGPSGHPSGSWPPASPTPPASTARPRSSSATPPATRPCSTPPCSATPPPRPPSPARTPP